MIEIVKWMSRRSTYRLFVAFVLSASSLFLSFGLVKAFASEILLESQGTYWNRNTQTWENILSVSRIPLVGPPEYRNHLEVGPQQPAFPLDNSVQFTYDLFEKNSLRRPALQVRGQEVLKAEDEVINSLTRSVSFRFFESKTNQTVAFYILFDGNFTDGPPWLPCQGESGAVVLRYAKLGIPIFDLRRLGKGDPRLPIETLLKLISFHLTQAGYHEFAIYGRTDSLGARRFKRLGFVEEHGPQSLGAKDEYILSFHSANFLSLYPPIQFQTDALAAKALYSCDEVFADSRSTFE